MQTRIGMASTMRLLPDRARDTKAFEAARPIVTEAEQYGRSSPQAWVGHFLKGCEPGAAGAVAGRRSGRAATMGAAARAASMVWVRMVAPPALGLAGAWAAPSWAAGAWPGAARGATGAPALGSVAAFARRFLGPRRVALGPAPRVPRRRIPAPGRSRSGPPRRSGRLPPGSAGGIPRPDLPPVGWLCARKTARPAAARSPGGTDRSGGR
jgi:hypothetical protein